MPWLTRVRPRATSVSRVISEPLRPLAFRALQGLVARGPDHREHVAADAGHHRLDDGQHRRRRHRRVDRVAAALEHGQPGAVASGWLVAIAAFGAYTVDRPAKRRRPRRRRCCAEIGSIAATITAVIITEHGGVTRIMATPLTADR